jgi:hypothetical protein
LTVVVPAAIPKAEPDAEIVAALEFEELQLTTLVRLRLPLVLFPVALNCWVLP